MKGGLINFPREVAVPTVPAGLRLALAAGLLGLCLGGVSARAQVRDISNSIAHRNVFLVAHQDDWQVFMGDAVYGILKTGSPATFIYLTAGDDGRDSVYWQTRERAALRSTWVAMGNVVPEPQEIQCATITVVKHVIRKCSLGKTQVVPEIAGWQKKTWSRLRPLQPSEPASSSGEEHQLGNCRRQQRELPGLARARCYH